MQNMDKSGSYSSRWIVVVFQKSYIDRVVFSMERWIDGDNMQAGR